MGTLLRCFLVLHTFSLIYYWGYIKLQLITVKKIKFNIPVLNKASNEKNTCSHTGISILLFTSAP
jgi:hypothetical protein